MVKVATAFIVLFLMALLLPARAGAMNDLQYKVVLKDKTVILVEDCWEEGGDIVYEKLGGKIWIDKKYVKEVVPLRPAEDSFYWPEKSGGGNKAKPKAPDKDATTRIDPNKNEMEKTAVESYNLGEAKDKLVFTGLIIVSLVLGVAILLALGVVIISVLVKNHREGKRLAREWEERRRTG